MTATGLPREKCDNCGFTHKYTRQEPGEIAGYCAAHEHWLCKGCRDHIGCTAAGHKIEQLPARIDVTGVPANDGKYANVSEDAYHGDLKSLSSSGARDLTRMTPEEFDFHRHQRRDPNKTLEYGQVTHKMVLGKGPKLFVLDPKVHGLTADNKPAKSPGSTAMWRNTIIKARKDGLIPVAKADMQKAQNMAGRVFQHRVAARLLSAGDAEHSIYWHDDATGVRRRIRPDFLPELPGRPLCVDYKSAKSADPKQFERAVLDYGYHQQQAFYEDGLAELGMTDVGFLFIVQAKEPPYTVSVVPIKPEIVELGRQQNRMALELFARCMEQGYWPGYEGIQSPVGMPHWAVQQIESQLESFYQPGGLINA